MSRLTGLAARITFAGALAAGVGFAGEAKAFGQGTCNYWNFDDPAPRQNGYDETIRQAERDLLLRESIQQAAKRWGLCIEGGGGVSRLDAPTSSYFGVRNVIGGAQSDFLRGNSTVNGGVFGGAVTFGGGELFAFRPFPAPASVTIGGSYANFSQINFVGAADPGPNRLLAFGTGVDPSGPGFDIGPGGGGFNDAFNSRYSRDVERFDVFGQFNLPIVRTPGGFRADLVARVGYTRTNIDETQFVEVRNVPLDIFNATDFGVNTFTPGAGFQVVAPVNNFFAVHLQAWAGGAFSDVSGSDNFAFSGLLNGAQHNSISGSHVGFAGGASGGISVDLGGGFGASATVSYLTTDSYPIIVRTGQAGERSREKWEDAEKLEVFFSTWLRFGS